MLLFALVQLTLLNAVLRARGERRTNGLYMSALMVSALTASIAEYGELQSLTPESVAQFALGVAIASVGAVLIV